MSRVAPQPGSERGRSGEASEIKTFLIADLRGYTRFSQEHGDAAAARLTGQFAEIAGEAVEAHGGDVVELRGDEVLAVFGSARRALRSAVELQEVLAREVEDDPALPLLAGIGLDAGEVVPMGEGYRGRALNLAARLCSKASAGQILATSQVVHLAGQVENVSFTSLGAVDLKGVDAPVEAVIVAPRVDQALPRREPSRPLGRAELPIELDSTVPLVRRERDLRRLRWLQRRAGLGRGQACLVAGPTGIGKTRLVSEIAEEAAESGTTITYVRGANPAEPSLDLLARSTEEVETALVIIDDLDASAPSVVDAVEEMLAAIQRRPVMILATARTPSPRIERMFTRVGAASLELAPLDQRGVNELAALYTRGTDLRVPDDVLEPAAGIPALIHRIASEWATGRATERVSDAASLAADGRPMLAQAEADVASRVTDLELTRERSRLYLHRAEPEAVVCPFKGLASYQPEDADFFFGRERLVAELTARVVGATFLGVVGPSGSGKSSAVKAGLVPALASGVLPQSDRWPCVVIRPGEHPAQALNDAARRITETASRRIVIVDQFEELFTTCVDEGERREFVAGIAALSAEPALVVAALRADYYGRCAAYPELARMFGTNHVLVGPMDADELRRAIELPARRAGLSVEPELTEALVADVADQAGALPLLSTKLLELWQLRDRRTLTLARYRETGGVQAAVAGLAEAAYSKLSTYQQELARTMLMRMAIVDEDGAVVRRRAHLDEFETSTDPDAEQVLRVLTDARLLTTSAGYVEVAHEALLREWPRLRDWLREDAEGTQLHHHLIQAARDWDERGRDRGDLYRGPRLSAALDWTATHEPALNQLEHDFLTASRDAHQQDIRRLRVLLAAALVLMAAALVASAVAYVQRGSAQRAATVADARGLGAQAQLQPHLDLALLLARESVALDSIPETRSDLLQTLLRSPQALIIRHVPGAVSGPTPFALSADGRSLAVGTIDGKVQFLDSRTLKTIRAVTPPGGFKPGRGPATIAASPRQPLYAIGSSWSGDGTIALLDARTGRPVGHIMRIPNVNFIDAVAFSPDGRTLAAGFMRPTKGSCLGGQGASYLVTRFDLATGRRLAPTTNITGSTVCGDSIDKLFYSPSGRELFATDRQGGEPLGRIVAMRASDLKVVHIYPLPGVTAATFNPQGTTLAVETDYGGLVLMSYPGGVVHKIGSVSPVWSVAYTPDGRRLITTSADHSIAVWDVRTKTIVDTLVGHTNAVTSQAISPNGDTLYTASPDATVIKWNIGGHGSALRDTIQTSPQYPANLFSHPQPTALAVSPNGKLLATSPGQDRIQLWNLQTLQPVGPGMASFHERDQQFSADGAATLAFSPNDQLLAAGGTHGSSVIVWNVRTGKVVDRFAPPTSPECRAQPNGVACPHGGGLAFSPNGQVLADGDAAGAVLLWNLRTRKATKLPMRKGDWAQSLGFSASGNDLIVGTVNNNGVLWNLANRKRIATFEADQQGALGPSSIAPASHSPTFVYGANNAVFVRSSTTGRVIGPAIPILSGYAGSIAVSPDGKTVALTAGDGVEVWDTSTGTEITPPLPGAPTQTSNPGGAGNIAFTPDGRRLLISSPTGLTTIWTLSPSVWAQQACQIAGRDMTQAEWHKYIPDRGYKPVCPRG